MKKDLQSYKKHDSEFNTDLNSIKRTSEIIKKYDEADQFFKLGFENAINMSKPLPQTHIDVGSGNGWLVRKTASMFKDVIGIEPSIAGITVAKEVNKTSNNVRFINKDMIDGLNHLKPSLPVFLTTATVLSHIEDFYVREFLKIVNDLPINSTLFFDERYDKNINWNMWHIRNKDWWIENLPNWQLMFFNIENSGYASGIFGVCRDKRNILPNHKMSSLEVIWWKVSGIYFIVVRVIRKICKIIFK